jgi:hypothetical protein
MGVNNMSGSHQYQGANRLTTVGKPASNSMYAKKEGLQQDRDGNNSIVAKARVSGTSTAVRTTRAAGLTPAKGSTGTFRERRQQHDPKTVVKT